MHREFVDIAREDCPRAGVRFVDSMTDAEVITRGVSFANAAGDFASLLVNVMNKSLASSFFDAPSSALEWVKIVSISDFKTASIVHLSEVDDLVETPGLYPIENIEVADGAESGKLETSAAVFSSGRPALINDDLGALSGI